MLVALGGSVLATGPAGVRTVPAGELAAVTATLTLDGSGPNAEVG